MMKKMPLIILLMLLPQILLAYEPDMLNLRRPSAFKSGEGEFKIQHRFYGKVSEDPLSKLFGMDSGANVGVSLGYMAWSKLELGVSRFRDRREGVLKAGYTYPLPGMPIQTRGDVQFFRYEEYDPGANAMKQKNGIFGLLSLQTEPLFNRAIPVLNVGYDTQNQELGVGIGVAITVLEPSGTVQKVVAIGEIFPTTSQSENDRSYAFGVRFETYGHHFDLILHNNSEMDVRRLMSGTIKDAGLRFGFNIGRKFF